MGQSFWQKLQRVKAKDIGNIFVFALALPVSAVYKRKRKDLWLICDNENEARDNGYWLYKYIREHHKEQDVMYAINKKSPDYARVKDLGPVVQYGSFMHWLYYLTASKNISSQKEGKPNAAVCYLLEVYGILKNKRIFLQHGITKDDVEFLHYKNTKINIIDTPGHADFGGEVERVLKMVDGVILLVDAFEGAMPQTKFVLKKALELDLHVIVCINKIDRPEARPDEVVDEVLELLMDLGASDEQLDCPFLYASAKAGHAVIDLNDTPKDMAPLFEAILKYIPAPEGDPEADTQVLISTIDYNEYVGRIGVGKVENGTIAVNQELTLLNHHDLDKRKKVKISKLYEFDGLNKVEVKEATIGAIVAISGIADIHIGDTLCAGDNPEAIPFQKISEPTIAMNFIVNDSPLAGQEGKYITSRHLRDRLYRELNTDVSLRVEDTDTTEAFKVSGRGELHLSVLIENMRREGYEFAVSKPEVLYKTDERGKKLEPMEIAYVDVPEEFSGTVIQKLSERKGELQGMSTASDGTVRLEFHIPSRGLIGFRGEFLTSTKGTGIINTMFDGYAPYKGDFQYRKQGSLIAFEAGEAVTYGLFAAQERGTLFIGPGAKVYSGMVIGQNGKAEDIELNVCKTKHLTNTRSSSADDALKLTPPRVLSLEQAIDFIDQDELLEVTPVSLRIRKRLLDSRERKRAAFRKA